MIEKMIQFNIFNTSVNNNNNNNGSVSVYDTYLLGKFYFYLFFLNKVVNSPLVLML